MSTLVKSYFYSFMHPFEYPRFIKDRSREDEIETFSTLEGISLGWIAQIISGMILLSFFYLGDSLTGTNPGLLVELPSSFFIYLTVIGVILFPLKAMVSILIWKFALRIFSLPYIPEEELEVHLDELMAHTTSSYILTMVPILGPLIQETFWIIYLFAGLKNIFGLSTPQALSVITFFTLFTFLIIVCLFLSLVLILSI